MKLCIDTCTNVCSVAVVEGEKIISERLYNDKLKHSEILMVEIDDMIKKLDRKPEDIKEIYVSNGPGSFTGIRIGVTAANTMADMLNVEVKSFSVLDLIAANVLIENEIVCSMLDARNDRYYVAIYTKTNDKIELLLNHDVYEIDELINHIKSNYDSVTFVGDINENHVEKLLGVGKFVMPILNIPRAGVMPFLDEELISNDLIDEKYVKPIYLEKSQAERQMEQRNNG